MRIGRLYTRIFLLFLGGLVLAELLTFGVFRLLWNENQYAGGASGQLRKLGQEYLELKLEHAVRAGRAAPLESVVRELSDSFPEAHIIVEDEQGHLVATNRPAPASFSKRENTASDQLRRKASGEFWLVWSVRAPGYQGLLTFRVLPTVVTHGRFLVVILGIGVAFTLVSIPVFRILGARLRGLHDTAMRLARGDLSARATIRGHDEIGELAGAFNLMADQVEAMLRGSRELMAHMSHELRSPLARLSVAEELLRARGAQTDTAPEHNRYLDTIRAEIDELNRLIGRILDLSRAQLQSRVSPRSTLELRAFVQDVLDRFGALFARRGLRVQVTGDQVPLPLRGDPQALRTALENLCENAAKYALENTDVLVELRTLPVSGETERSGAQLECTIRNRCRPISPELLEHLFTPFYRGPGGPAEGTGLGLAISREIIENHGGQIDAVNTPEGFGIRIRLPRA